MPEGSVDEHGEPGRAECDVRAPREVAPMTTPTANAERPQSTAQGEFGLCIAVLDPAHDPASLFLAEHVGHGRLPV